MDLQDEEPWLRARIANLRLIMPLVPHPHAQARLQALLAAMEKRLASLEHRRLHPLDADEAPGG